MMKIHNYTFKKGSKIRDIAHSSKAIASATKVYTFAFLKLFLPSSTSLNFLVGSGNHKIVIENLECILSDPQFWSADVDLLVNTSNALLTLYM